VTDVLNDEQRSYCMSRIKGSNTKPELKLRKALWNLGYRYRLKSHLVGKPDFVFPRFQVAVFVDGCFWHKCPKHFQQPKKNREFWVKKIAANTIRDGFVTKELQHDGWAVVRIWEHQVKQDFIGAVSTVRRILEQKKTGNKP